MRVVRTILILLVLVCVTTSLFSGTLARYSTSVLGTDTALIAKWNFNIAEFDGTFVLIEGNELLPQASGSKTFTLKSDGSDTAMDYTVTMNVDEFKAVNAPDVPPLIFYVTVPADVTQPSAVTGWFSLDNPAITGDFVIAQGNIPEGDTDPREITVDWWWNTSFFVTPGNGLDAEDTDTVPEDYYEKASASYSSAVSSLNSAVAQEEAYASHYVLYPEQSVTDGEGNTTVTPAYYAWDDPAYTDAGYAALQSTTSNRRATVRNHTKRQYDEYDTAVMEALELEANMPKVGFTATAEQTMPE